jgi:hypothetical protein
MRAVLPAEIERQRIMGVPGSGPYGVFRLVHPHSGRTLQVIASDGRDWAEVGLPGEPWEHVSVSRPVVGGVPTWGEMCWVRSVFFEPEEWVVQYHPAESEYVNEHPGVLHLWRPCGVAIPTPPKECV